MQRIYNKSVRKYKLNNLIKYHLNMELNLAAAYEWAADTKLKQLIGMNPKTNILFV